MKNSQPNTPSRQNSTPSQTASKPHLPYDTELAILICELIASTPQSLLTICKHPDMPSIANLFRWLNDHAEFRELYAHAKQAQAELLIEQSLDIVDNTHMDCLIGPDEEPIPNPVSVQRARLRVEHRRWIAAKLLPHKYGNDHSATDPKPAPDSSLAVTLKVERPCPLQEFRHSTLSRIPLNHLNPNFRGVPPIPHSTLIFQDLATPHPPARIPDPVTIPSSANTPPPPAANSPAPNTPPTASTSITSPGPQPSSRIQGPHPSDTLVSTSDRKELPGTRHFQHARHSGEIPSPQHAATNGSETRT